MFQSVHIKISLKFTTISIKCSIQEKECAVSKRCCMTDFLLLALSSAKIVH